jgi:hypothetical protein
MINTHETNPTHPTAPARLSLRVRRDNPFHHLWENNGTWWVHFTEHLPDFTKRRVRRSLGTKDPEEAIRRRDALFTAAARAA